MGFANPQGYPVPANNPCTGKQFSLLSNPILSRKHMAVDVDASEETTTTIANTNPTYASTSNSNATPAPFADAAPAHAPVQNVVTSEKMSKTIRNICA
eukprot:8407447-Ditylum_brightwellii.AAC.1